MRFDRNGFALTVLGLSALLGAPTAALSQSCENVASLCELAAANPERFSLRRSLDETLQCMAAECSDTAALVQSTFDARFVTVMPGPKVEQEGGAAPVVAAVATVDLLTQLTNAKADLTAAAARVDTAEENMMAALGMVKLAVSAKPVVEAAVNVRPRVLRDYTRQREQALYRYQIAKLEYDAAVADLEVQQDNALELVASAQTLSTSDAVLSDAEARVAKTAIALLDAIANLKEVATVTKQELAIKKAYIADLEEIGASLEDIVVTLEESTDLLEVAAEEAETDEEIAATEDLLETVEEVTATMESWEDTKESPTFMAFYGTLELEHYEGALEDVNDALREAKAITPQVTEDAARADDLPPLVIDLVITPPSAIPAADETPAETPAETEPAPAS